MYIEYYLFWNIIQVLLIDYWMTFTVMDTFELYEKQFLNTPYPLFIL